MARIRMYEPWGYQDENNYQSSEITMENDFESFFTDASYKDDDKSIHFYNKDGNERVKIDVTKFAPSVVESATYDEETKILTIEFSNGDKIQINLAQLIDEHEFGDGLNVEDGIVSIKIDAEGEPYISVGENGVKISGVDQAIADAVDAEKTRAEQAESELQEAIAAEETRATGAEQTLDEKIDAEETRAKAAEATELVRAEAAEAALNTRADSLNDTIVAEKTIREAADVALGERIDQEISDRIADVDAEETRAKAVETELQAEIESEGQRAQDAETALDEKIESEEERALSAETALAGAINDLDSMKFDDVSYDSEEKEIIFFANGVEVKTLDAKPFIKDGMVDDVKIEDGKLVIVFNTDSGKETIEIPLSDIFNPNNYYDKDAVDDIISGVNESIASEASERAEKDEALEESIEDEKTRAEGAEITLQTAIDAEAARAISAETDLNAAIELKADKETTYTQTEVDALIKAKETEIYNLTKLVGEIGGNVTYTYPNELGTSLTSLLNNYGTVKLAEDATITRFGPGVTAKNKVTLNLNNHNLTSTSAGSYGAIMARGTQEITIGGKGTIDAGNGICIEANGTSSLSPLATFNLTGSTTVYRNNNPGGELIYCYVGIINITNGTFRNDGGSEYMLNCYDANYAAGTAKIIVTGGKFYDFNPADNKAEGEHTSFVPEGYHVETSTVIEEGVEHTVYTVKKNA